jgi:hypothetical protein
MPTTPIPPLTSTNPAFRGCWCAHPPTRSCAQKQGPAGIPAGVAPAVPPALPSVGQGSLRSVLFCSHPLPRIRIPAFLSPNRCTISSPLTQRCQRVSVGMRCQPARLDLVQRAPTASRVHLRISAAPAGRPPRHWRGAQVVLAADEGAAPAQPMSGEQSSQPPPSNSLFDSACAAVARAFSTPSSNVFRPGQVRRWLAAGWARHSPLLQVEPL